MKDNKVYIKHIQEGIDSILTYTKSMDQAEFLANKLVQDAVIRNLQIIGEAAKKISEEFRSKHDQIPWKQMAGMRDKLIHDYMGVDLWAVWLVVEIELPKLNPQLNTLVSDLDS